MGLFDSIFGRKQSEQEMQINNYFKTLNAYTPIFNNYNDGIYEMELTRAVIHAFANQCAKLKPEINGSVYKKIEKKLQFKPNEFMDTYKFIYRVATILEVENTAFIVPVFEDDFETICGYYPILPSRVEVIEYQNEPYLRYSFLNGEKAVIELNRVGIMNKFFYKDDFFGSNNQALQSTLNLINIQQQGIEEGIRQGAMIRFMAKLAGNHRPDDIEEERNRFTKSNFSMENNNGVMMFDGKYSDIKQVTNQSFIADSEQMKLINNNVYNYFGINEKILQNRQDEDEWNAYYENKIEPFALQLSLVLTNMTFTEKEIENGSEIFFTSNRLQFASNKTKLEISSSLLDRGVLTVNQVLEIWNLPTVEDGNTRYIRKEYAELDDVNNIGSLNETKDNKEGESDNE